MNKFLKKILGIDKIQAKVEEALNEKIRAEAVEKEAKDRAEAAIAAAAVAEAARVEAENFAKLGEKEAATARKEPFVKVLQVHVNDQNIRNGFFELDWNEYFVLQLKADGYYGDTDEDIVNSWFTEICRYAATETGIDPSRRQTGYIDVVKREDGKSEIS